MLLSATRWLRGALAVIVLATSTGLLSAQDPAAEGEAKPALPLGRVVMFSSGVAFYERRGDVEGDATIDLRFNTRDINDLLKSMVLEDLGGGQISTVSYGSKDPITRTLRTFSIDLTTSPTLGDLLAQIRGERIELDSPTPTSGVIVGIEKRDQKVGDQVVQTSILTLLTDEGLRNISLDNIGRIKLSNPKLDAELRQALLVLAMGKSADKKSVSLSFTGKGKRPVRVGYIQESPIWKTSYRLVLDDEKQPLLQGWAIVENTTEEDWNNVNLTLISGRPISFTMDLYQPLYIDRPEVKPELYASLTPRTYDQSMAEADREFEALAHDEKSRDAAAKPAMANRRMAEAASNGVELQMMKRAEDKAFNPASGVQSVATASDVGELFQYRIATPVSLERQKSAMLPIVNDSVKGEKVSIYSESSHAKHPLSGVRLKNSTDLHLMQGPITVFDGGAYAGDAQIQDLQPGTERLISYALDLDTEVAPSIEGLPEELVSVKVVRGVLESSRKYGRKKNYVIKNSSKKTKQVLIEYPVEASWNLIEPKEATEKTRDLYRFAVAAEPGVAANLLVREERVDTQRVALANCDDNMIRFYIQAAVVSPALKEKLGEVIKRKEGLALLVAKRGELERQVTVIFEEQTRIRQNMEQLPKDSDLFRRYVTKFNEQEDKVEQLREQIKKAIDDENNGRNDLNNFLSNIDLS
ncbi:conserved hypothetical protein [Pirellula staleyi DSM 6068]|uniref:DUF4139 domain-containing protein n=1 Tax=Pirellula staleyi (strain ATCC 27377 / DSM 6068 / ICPB 4128) TaxID=530564 RepID=D2QXB4_PIRSD|nr:DUF4139 domain-containing protein [Pirellula staleyi]ADB17954.1 conserved hypothetical protein [Pirellula staleyi DSM 6068]